MAETPFQNITKSTIMSLSYLFLPPHQNIARSTIMPLLYIFPFETLLFFLLVIKTLNYLQGDVWKENAEKEHEYCEFT